MRGRRQKARKINIKKTNLSAMAVYEHFESTFSAMSTFRKTRNCLLESFNNGDISEDEFLLLYDANTSKNQDFPYECYGNFNLEEMDESECLSEFRFRKSDIPRGFGAA